MGLFLLLHIPLALYPRVIQKVILDYDNLPFVTIVIPTFFPNILALESNFKKISEIKYNNYEIIVVDNSTDVNLINKIKSLTSKNNVRFFHRKSSRGFKSGNINYILDQIKGKYILFIDIDQILIPDSIEKFVEVLEADKSLAFVQAKYKIKNDNSIIRIAIAIMYAYYYEILSRGKDLKNTVLFNGTTGCFRKSAILQVNGFPEDTYCEDIDISTKLLIAGYKSRFLNEYATIALVPWRLRELISSIWRWAHGATSIAKLRFKSILTSKNVRILTKFELFMNNLVWITGASIVLISSCLTTMYLLKWEILRPQYSLIFNENVIIIEGFQFIAIFFSLSTFFGSLLAVISSKKVTWLLNLPLYFIASLSLFFFIFPAVISALFNKNLPNDEKSQWNKDLNYSLYGIIMIPFGVINGIIAFDAFSVNNFIWIFFIIIAIGTICPFFFIYMDKYINNDELEQDYFQNLF
jgi:cellulose synthase/poly-beta-1,6-N-acetylglucosamine synthase-like glycosyltransferase